MLVSELGAVLRDGRFHPSTSSDGCAGEIAGRESHGGVGEAWPLGLPREAVRIRATSQLAVVRRQQHSQRPTQFSGAEMQFEWDPKKAAINRRDHKVTFEEAVTALEDEFSDELRSEYHREDFGPMVRGK